MLQRVDPITGLEMLQSAPQWKTLVRQSTIILHFTMMNNQDLSTKVTLPF